MSYLLAAAAEALLLLASVAALAIRGLTLLRRRQNRVPRLDEPVTRAEIRRFAQALDGPHGDAQLRAWIPARHRRGGEGATR